MAKLDPPVGTGVPQRRRRRLLTANPMATARAPRESWPSPSTPTSAAGARSFLQGNGDFHSDQGPRPATHPVNSACSGSPSLSVTWCNDYEEDRRLLDLRPHLLGVAAQGAQLLLRQVPRATSPLGLQEARPRVNGSDRPRLGGSSS